MRDVKWLFAADFACGCCRAHFYYELFRGIRLHLFFVLLGCALLIWYLAPLAAAIFNVGNAAGSAFSAYLILFGAFFNSLSCWLQIFGCCIAIAVFAAAVPVSIKMAKYSNYKTNCGAETVIVLGCRVKGTKPSLYLYKRCMAAAAYLKENPDAVAILSGGQGKDEDISEARCMQTVLAAEGIDKSRLIAEDKSKNTRENIFFSKQIIESLGLSRSVLIVTNEFHEYRAKMLCDEANLEFHSKCSYSAKYTFLTFYTRELMGVYRDYFLKLKRKLNSNEQK